MSNPMKLKRFRSFWFLGVFGNLKGMQNISLKIYECVPFQPRLKTEVIHHPSFDIIHRNAVDLTKLYCFTNLDYLKQGDFPLSGTFWREVV